MTTDSTADGHVAPEPPEQSQSDEARPEKSARDRKTWERALFMVLFAFVGYFTLWAIFLIAIVQLIVVLVTREPNEDLRGFSRNLAEYVKQIAAYLGFVTDEMPCPFSPFPKADHDAETP